MPKTVTITLWDRDEDPLEYGGFDVTQGEQSAGGGLTLGEMLEQVLAAFKPQFRSYPTKTRAEWMARRYIDYADLNCPCDDAWHFVEDYIPF